MTTRCPLCRYPRAGLDRDAPCPECGRHPEDILPLLAEEPAEFRRRLALGARLACVSIGARIAHGAAMIAAAVLAGDAFLGVLWIGLALVAALNLAAGFLLTTRGDSPGRPWLRRTVRPLGAAELIAALAGSTTLLADTPAWVGWTLLGVIGTTWVGRSLIMVGVIGTLASRLRSDKLQAQLRGWLKYAGIAAMTPIVAVIAAALTALIPILAPFTVIAAAPYLVFVGVLVVIALVGSIALHARLASELQEVI